MQFPKQELLSSWNNNYFANPTAVGTSSKTPCEKEKPKVFFKTLPWFMPGTQQRSLELLAFITSPFLQPKVTNLPMNWTSLPDWDCHHPVLSIWWVLKSPSYHHIDKPRLTCYLSATPKLLWFQRQINISVSLGEKGQRRRKVSLGFRGIIRKPVDQPDEKRQLLFTRGQSPTQSKKMRSSPKSDQVSYSILSRDSQPSPARASPQLGRERPPTSKSCFGTKVSPAQSQVIILPC